MELRSHFASDEDYEEFMIHVTPEEFADLRKQLFQELEGQSKTPPSGLEDQIAQQFNRLSSCGVVIILNKFGIEAELQLEWEGDSVDDITCSDVVKIKPVSCATDREKALIEIIDSEVSSVDFVDIAWSEIKATPQFVAYQNDIQEFVDRINQLSEEYPDKDWWD